MDNPFNPSDPKNKQIVEQAHADAKADFAGKDDDAAKEDDASKETAADSSDDAAGDDKGKKGKGGFKWGNGIAGLLGVAGAWLISSMLGGGWLGTLMFALLAIPGFMIGRQQLGNTFSGWIGEPTDAPAKVKGTELAQAQATDVGNGQSAAVAAAPQLTAQQNLRQEVAEVAEKSQIARATVMRLVQTGELTPRRGETALRNIARTDQMVQQMQTLNVDQLSDDQLKRIAREFNQAENYLDRTIGQNPILAAQIQQSGAFAAPAMPMGAPAMQDARPVMSYQSNGMVNPNFAMGAVLTPDAQMQLQAMRQGGPNYQYQQAPTGQYSAPNFNGQPDMGYQAVYSQYK